MKVLEVCSILDAYAASLAGIGADGPAAVLRKFNRIGVGLKSSVQINQVVSHTQSLVVSDLATGEPSVGELVIVLASLETLASALATKKPNLIADLSQLQKALAGFAHVAIESYTQAILVHVASASKRKKREPADVNESLVSHYLQRLEQALPDENLFPQLFSELSEDEHVQQVEAVAIASRFMGPTAPSTSRSKALQKIMARHTSLMKSRASARAQHGKSAA